MKIHQYNEMMKYLTRKPTPVTSPQILDTSSEQRETLAKGTKPKSDSKENKKKETSLTSKVSNKLGMGPAAIADVGGEVVEDVKGLYGKYAPQIAKGALTGLKVIGTPAVSAGLYAQDVYSDLKDAAKEGSVIASKALDTLVGQGEKGLYFMLPELAKDVITNPIASKILQLGSVGRFASPFGIGLSAAGVAKDFYNQYKEFEALPQEQQELLRKQFIYEPTEQDFQRMQEAESRASAATGGMVKRENYAFGSLLKRFISQIKDVVSPVAQPTTSNTLEIPLTVQERYNKYLSQPSASTVDLGGGGLSDLFRRLISKVAVANPQTAASTNDQLYNLYRSGVDGKANGGRIGYAEGTPMAGLVYVGSWEGPWMGPEFIGGPRKGQYYNKGLTANIIPGDPLSLPTTTIDSLPLTVRERYNKYLSAAGSGTSDDLYKLYRSSIDKKANGGRIGYANGSDELEIPLLNENESTSKKRLGPEDPISKYGSYSELEILGNISAKKPNYEIEEEYMLRNMPVYEPKDIVPKGAIPVMPNEYNRGPNDGILELARGGRVKSKK